MSDVKVLIGLIGAWLGDVELLADVDSVKELTDILPLHRSRLLDACRW